MSTSRPLVFVTLAIVWVASSSIGCSTLTTSSLSTKLEQQTVVENSVQQANATTPAVETCVVEVQSFSGKSRRFEVPITNEMTVQDIVKAVQVRKLFSRITIELHRPIAKSPKPLKMPVTVDGFGKRVNPAYNYAIRPGDHLILKEDPTNTFDDMLDGVLKPLGVSSSR